jgi:hypothetical protein
MLYTSFPTNFLPNERFFVEKILELLHPKTIDTFRCRLYNPHTILEELHSVLVYFHKKKIKSFETVQKVKDEALGLLDTPNYLRFNSIEPGFLKTQINNIDKSKYLDATYTICLVLKDNETYLETLIKKTYQLIYRGTLSPIRTSQEFQELSTTITYLVTELLNRGYSKRYLYKVLYLVLIKDQVTTSFRTKFANTIKAINRRLENFDIFYRIHIPLDLQDILINSAHVADETLLNTFFNNGSAKTKKYLELKDNPQVKYLHFTIASLDFHSAVIITRKKLAEILDSIHLGFKHSSIELHKYSLVIGENQPQSAGTESVFYQIDGSYRKGQIVYEEFIDNLSKLETNDKVSIESKQKIRSAIRHLRLGSEAIELEQKFTSYWLGLEYIFSNYDSEANTFNRISDNFSIAHLLVFFKRNLIEFHNDIKRLGYHVIIPGYSEDLKYLLKEETYQLLETNCFNDHPLLAFRSNQFYKSVFNNNQLVDDFKKHEQDLTWNIARLYRIRNELIHEAAIDKNIPNITSHLKYYLSFIIESTLNHFVTNSLDIDIDNYSTIEDYFIIQKLKWDNIKSSNYNMTKLLEVYVP